ncbi:MAG TPA: hypothetical protein PLN33_14205 [Hyphomonadaceae bacterium]|nr:hypothetical protein [Hyphomonadaceae bacterium]HPN05793.1 hypothetical protein [Hyphomonadaceae bacterium]
MSEAVEPPAEPMAKKVFLHRDRAEYLAFISQIVSAIAVVVSLVFVGLQLREGNDVAARDESNATMTQWSAFRASIYSSHDTAEVFTAGLSRSRPLDQADQMRFLYIMREHAWATFQVWDRAQNGLVDKWNFEVGAANDFFKVICTPGGAPTWAQIKTELPPAYVADMDRLIVPYARSHGAACVAAPAVTPPPSAPAALPGG